MFYSANSLAMSDEELPSPPPGTISPVHRVLAFNAPFVYPESTNIFLVVVTLITSLSFSISVNPPWGLWQDDDNSGGGGRHVAGTAIMASKDPVRYGVVTVANWLCFYSSLLLILWLLTEKVPTSSRLFKLQFGVCIAGLVFIYLASQMATYLPWALITFVLMALYGASAMFASKIN